MTMRLDIVTNDAGDLVRREHARDLGAGVVLGIYRLAKLAQMHDLGNQAFLRQLEQSTNVVHDYCLRAGSNVNILFAQKAVFVAGQLLKGSRAVYEQAIELGDILEWCGGSELVVLREVTTEDMLGFAEAISQATRSERGTFRSPSPKIRLRPVDDKARLRGLEIERLTDEQRIVRTYASAVVIMRRFFEDLLASKYILPRRIKRIAQSLVDLSGGGTAAYLGVTEARNANHDDAGRAVNSAILAVAMAREITEDRVTLAQIAMAAMMHDVGRPRAQALGATPGMPQMPGVMALSEEQEDRLPGGTAAVLTALGRVNEPSITRTVLAFEALWIRRQAWIGPAYRGARQATLHAKIVALARRYNDIMTPEPGLEPPSPDFAVATLAEELTDSTDKMVLRMLVSALRIIPVGTVVQLSTGEVCEVIPRGSPGVPDRPRLRVALDAMGGVPPGAIEIDLEREPQRAIARVMSIDGWKKGLVAKPNPRDTDSPGSRRSVSAVRPADDASPSRPSSSLARSPASTSRPSGTAPSAFPRESSAPSGSAFASVANTPGASPAAMADAAAKIALESRAPSVRPPTVSPAATSSRPPADIRTVVSESPWHGRSEPPKPIRTEAEPTARGSLESTPMAHVLVYMLEHMLSGSVVFGSLEIGHVVHFENGVPTKVRLVTRDNRLGEVLVARGALAADLVDEVVHDARALGLLLGEYCVTNGLVQREALSAALEEQLLRKIASLANLAAETPYAFYRDVNHLEGWGGSDPVRTAPLNPILFTVRAWRDRARMQTTLNRIGKHPLVFHEDADLEGLLPTEDEQRVVDTIVTRACSLPQLLEMNVAPELAVHTVVYALAVTRQFAFRGLNKPPMAARVRPSAPVAARPRAPVSLRPLFRPSTSPPFSPVSIVPPPKSSDSGSLPPAPPSSERAVGSAPPSDRARAPAAMTAAEAYRVAEASLQRGDLGQAMALARRAAEAEPANADYRAFAAWATAMNAPPSDVGGSIDELSQVLADHPSCERALLYRGKLHKRAGRMAEALADLEALLKGNPKHREAAAEVRLLRVHVQ